jgi:hypothetical protein
MVLSHASRTYHASILFGGNTIVGAGCDMSDFQYIQRILDELIVDEFTAQDGHTLGPAEIHEYLSQVMCSRRTKIERRTQPPRLQPVMVHISPNLSKNQILNQKSTSHNRLYSCSYPRSTKLCHLQHYQCIYGSPYLYSTNSPRIRIPFIKSYEEDKTCRWLPV